MSIKSKIGFGGLSISSDDLVAVVGTGTIITYQTADPPNTFTDIYARSFSSAGAACFREWDAFGSASEFWIGGWTRVSGNNTVNDAHRLGWGTGTTTLGWITLEDNTNRYKIVIDGATVATGTLSISLDVWEPWLAHVDMQNGPAGSVIMYRKGDLSTPMVSFTGNTDPTGAGSANSTYFRIARNSANDNFAAIFIMDPNDGTGIVTTEKLLNFGMEVRYPTADGFYSAWTPDTGVIGFSRINEAPPVDGSFVQATAVAQRSSFTFDVVSAPTVLSVSSYNRILRTGTDAGSQVSVFRRSAGVDYDDTAVNAPGAGNVNGSWDDLPTGDWTPTNLLATEFGDLSVL